jgi:hypothetical protein
VLQRQVGFHAGMFPLLFVTVALVNFALSAPSGHLAERFGRVRVFLAGHALLGCAYGAFMLRGDGVLRIAVCLLLVGAYCAATDGVLAGISWRCCRTNSCGTEPSIVSSPTNFGRLLSLMLFGFAWGAWGLQPAILAFIIGLGAALAAGMIVLRNAGAATTDAT